MRIKISVIDSKDLDNINIQDVTFLNRCDGGLPKLYFNCHKKFEYLFKNKTVIFHDKNGREFFRSSQIKPVFRYYESDLRLNKVEFSVNAIEFKRYGLLSKTYLRKILRGCCNAKVAPLEDPTETYDEPKKFSKKEIRRIVRSMYLQKSRTFKSKFYLSIVDKFKRIMRIFAPIYNQLCQKFIANKIDSTAPT